MKTQKYDWTGFCLSLTSKTLLLLLFRSPADAFTAGVCVITHFGVFGDGDPSCLLVYYCTVCIHSAGLHSK